VASFSNPKSYAGRGYRISNGSFETRPALCSRFRADGLQVAVTDDGKVLLGLYGRSGDDKCDIIGMYVELSRCEELEKTRLFQPLRAKDFLESRMHPYLIAGKKDSGQNDRGIRRKACCMSKYLAEGIKGSQSLLCLPR